jgi:hypothetical protein
MDWGEIAELCHDEWDRLRMGCPEPRALFEEPSGALTALLKYEQGATDQLEAAVRQWARDRTWPTLTDVECTLLCLRLEYAGQLAALLYEQPGWSSDGDDDESRLGWLMLFAWHEHGFPALQRTLELFVGQGGWKKKSP